MITLYFDRKKIIAKIFSYKNDSRIMKIENQANNRASSNLSYLRYLFLQTATLMYFTAKVSLLRANRPFAMISLEVYIIQHS